eukprot:ANDGO_02301.mRNA.1 hypothetical protein
MPPTSSGKHKPHFPPPPKEIAHLISGDGLHLSPRRPYSDVVKPSSTFPALSPRAVSLTGAVSSGVLNSSMPKTADAARLSHRHARLEADRQVFDAWLEDAQESEAVSDLQIVVRDLQKELENERNLERLSNERLTILTLQMDSLEKTIAEGEDAKLRIDHELEEERRRNIELTELIDALKAQMKEMKDVETARMKRSEESEFARRLKTKNDLLEHQRICFLRELVDLRRKFFEEYVSNRRIAPESQEWYEWRRKIMMSPEPVGVDPGLQDSGDGQSARSSKTVVIPLRKGVESFGLSTEKMQAQMTPKSVGPSDDSEAARESRRWKQRMEKMEKKFEDQIKELEAKIQELQCAQSESQAAIPQETDVQVVEVKVVEKKETKDVHCQTDPKPRKRPAALSKLEEISTQEPPTPRTPKDPPVRTPRTVYAAPKVSMDRSPVVEIPSAKSFLDSLVNSIRYMERFINGARERASKRSVHLAGPRSSLSIVGSAATESTATRPQVPPQAKRRTKSHRDSLTPSPEPESWDATDLGSNPDARKGHHIVFSQDTPYIDTLSDIPRFPDDVLAIRPEGLYLRTIRKKLAPMSAVVRENGDVVDSVSGEVLVSLQNDSLKKLMIQMQNRLDFLGMELQTSNDLVDVYEKEITALQKSNVEEPSESRAMSPLLLPTTFSPIPSGPVLVADTPRAVSGRKNAGAKDARLSKTVTPQTFFAQVVAELMNTKGGSPVKRMLDSIWESHSHRSIQFLSVILVHPPSKLLHRLLFLPGMEVECRRPFDIPKDCLTFHGSFSRDRTMCIPILMWTNTAASLNPLEAVPQDACIIAILEIELRPDINPTGQKTFLESVKSFCWVLSLMLSPFFENVFGNQLPASSRRSLVPAVSPVQFRGSPRRSGQPGESDAAAVPSNLQHFSSPTTPPSFGMSPRHRK